MAIFLSLLLLLVPTGLALPSLVPSTDLNITRVMKRTKLYPDPEPCTGDCSWVHDPSIFYEKGTYWRFTTSGNIGVATAPTLSGPWEFKGMLLHRGTKIKIGEPDQDIWAPNIVKVDKTYYAYYCVSVMGSKKSVLGVASSSSLKPGTWIDHGAFGIPSSSYYNLIDPNFFQETPSSREMYFTFGSYWTGIYQTAIDRTQLTRYRGYRSDLFNIVRNTTAKSQSVVEGAFQFAYENYYYLFFSVGECCRGADNLAAPENVYHVRVCRSRSITGPYDDKKGRSCLKENGGSIVLASHDDVYAPGGQGVMVDPESGRPVIYYHYVRPSVGYSADKFFFGYNYLDFSTGWPEVVFS